MLPTFAVLAVELRKLRRDPTDIAVRSVQPVLWLLVFGQVFGRIRGLSSGGLDYLDFLAPGILAQSVLFTGIFFGIAVIWERDLGILHKLLVSPASRASLVLGKAGAAGARCVAQAAVIYVVAAALGVSVRLAPGALLVVLGLVVVGAGLFATLSLVVACLVRTRERFMGIGQLMTMPLFFASNAIYPTDLMPGWLRVLVHLNPVSYLVDGLRTSMVGGASAFGLGVDVAVLVGVFAALVATAARLYPTVIR